MHPGKTNTPPAALSFAVLPLLLASALLLTACEGPRPLVTSAPEDTTVSSEDLLPLDVGNSWVYATENGPVTVEVLEDRVPLGPRIGYEVRYSREAQTPSYTYYSFSGDTIFTIDNLIPGAQQFYWQEDRILSRLAAAAPGDTLYHRHTQIPGEIDYRRTYTASSRSARAQVAAGTFTGCLEVLESYQVRDIPADTLLLDMVDRHLYKPGVGLVFSTRPMRSLVTYRVQED